MNAIEHGNQGRSDIPVEVEVVTTGGELVVRIRDVGEGPSATDVEEPDIEAKLAGLQKPRGWGLFLIENMVDEIRVLDADDRHTVELVLQLEGGDGDDDDSIRDASVRSENGGPVIELVGDVDARAEQALERRVLGGRGGDRRDARLRRRHVHELHRDRADRRPAGARPRERPDLSVCGLTPHYREIFEITRLADFMTIVDAEEGSA